MEMLGYAGLLWGTEEGEQDRQQREWRETSSPVLETARCLVSGWKSLVMEPIVEPMTGRPESGCSSVGLYSDCGEPSTLGTHFENH